MPYLMMALQVAELQGGTECHVAIDRSVCHSVYVVSIYKATRFWSWDSNLMIQSNPITYQRPHPKHPNGIGSTLFASWGILKESWRQI